MVSESRRLGRYHVVGHLATGGMAEIFLAKVLGPSGFERPFAIKRILPHLARIERFVSMFLQEARVSARIRHPNVVQIHDLGADRDDVYLVMEYLEGETCGGLLRRLMSLGRTLEPALAAHVIAEACAGLHAAHTLRDPDGLTHGLVHRDVSPQNLFVTYDGQVKVLDFGVAKALGHDSQTVTGEVKGKFAYMSPEQWRGRTVDARSDVFALGIVLYELTTRRRLFKHADDVMVLKAICELPIPPPSTFVDGYPPDLERVCLRALARERKDRYQSAAELRQDLLQLRSRYGATEDPGRELARLMREVFADRIEEKRQMLARVQAGSAVSRMPAAEVDEQIELPEITRQTVFELPDDSSRTWKRARHSAWAAFAVLALAVALVVGTAAVLVPIGGSAASPLHPAAPIAPRLLPAVVSAPPAEPVPVATTPPVSVAPRETLVHVESEPPGAWVLLEGRRAGATPLDLRLPARPEPLTIELRRRGYAPLVERIVPDVDQRLRLSLVRRSARSVSRTAPRFQRFD